MKKNRKFFFLLLFLISLGLTFWQLAFKEVAFIPACSCPPIGWKGGSAILQFLHNAFSKPDYADCSQFGCTIAYYIFPVDLVLTDIATFILFKKSK